MLHKKYLHIEIKADLLKQLKIKALNQDKTLKLYIIDILNGSDTKETKRDYILES